MNLSSKCFGAWPDNLTPLEIAPNSIPAQIATPSSSQSGNTSDDNDFFASEGHASSLVYHGSECLGREWLFHRRADPSRIHTAGQFRSDEGLVHICHVRSVAYHSTDFDYTRGNLQTLDVSIDRSGVSRWGRSVGRFYDRYLSA
jgi:hypothetical protein